MTAHACTTLQPVGTCYRCDLNRDEDAEPDDSGPSAEQERAWDEQYDGTSLGA